MQAVQLVYEPLLKKSKKAYGKLLNKICAKCKPKKSDEKKHCCYGFDFKNMTVRSNALRNNDFRSPMIKEIKVDGVVVDIVEYPPCSAYNSKVGCTAPKFRIPTCRSFYCSNWDEYDKKTILRGRFEEKSVNELIHHVKKVRPYVQDDIPTRYLILTQDPDKIGRLMMETYYWMNVVLNILTSDEQIRASKQFKFDVYIDNNTSLNSLDSNSKVFKNREVVVTNTPLEELLINDIDDFDMWFGIKYEVLDRFLFIVN